MPFGVRTFLRLCKMLRLTAVAAFLASASAFAPAAVPSRAVSKTGESYFCASIGSFRSLGCPRDTSANSRRGGWTGTVRGLCSRRLVAAARTRT